MEYNYDINFFVVYIFTQHEHMINQEGSPIYAGILWSFLVQRKVGVEGGSGSDEKEIC